MSTTDIRTTDAASFIDRKRISSQKARSVTGDNVNPTQEKLRRTVGEVVGSVFFGTLLKMSRESGLRGAYGHGGRGEEVFTGQLHGILTERMGTRLEGGIGEALYKNLERQQLRMQAAEISPTRKGSPS